MSPVEYATFPTWPWPIANDASGVDSRAIGGEESVASRRSLRRDGVELIRQ